MTAATGWLSEQHATDQRRFLNLLAGSFAAHAVFVGMLAITPMPDPPPLPDVLRVDLIASLPSPVRTPKSRQKPAPQPKPVPKQVLLPKEAPNAVPTNVAPLPKREDSLDYQDALSQLRNELGETAPPQVEPQTEVAPATATSIATAVDRETAAWVIETKRHVRSRYITPPEFLNRSLATGLEVLLTSEGELVGMPTVVAPSGDPFFDDNAVRAVMTSAPLPPPPRAGSYTFLFTSRDR
jgi:outer membrane biosynthesis protein TonB